MFVISFAGPLARGAATVIQVGAPSLVPRLALTLCIRRFADHHPVGEFVRKRITLENVFKFLNTSDCNSQAPRPTCSFSVFY